MVLLYWLTLLRQQWCTKWWWLECWCCQPQYLGWQHGNLSLAAGSLVPDWCRLRRELLEWTTHLLGLRSIQRFDLQLEGRNKTSLSLAGPPGNLLEQEVDQSGNRWSIHVYLFVKHEMKNPFKIWVLEFLIVACVSIFRTFNHLTPMK